MVNIVKLIVLSGLLVTMTSLPCLADSTQAWVQRWNSEAGRGLKLKLEDVILKESQAPELSGLAVAGFRNTDGSYVLGRVIWANQSWSPLQGFGKVLNSKKFSTLDDAARNMLFETLLQQSYGLLGTKVFTMEGPSKKDRPKAPLGVRGVNDSHRYKVWYYKFPVNAEEGEWREVLYTVSPDGSIVRATNLGAYHPISERLDGFPSLSPKLFE